VAQLLEQQRNDAFEARQLGQHELAAQQRLFIDLKRTSRPPDRVDFIALPGNCLESYGWNPRLVFFWRVRGDREPDYLDYLFGSPIGSS
jgi:hypothetical protein